MLIIFNQLGYESYQEMQFFNRTSVEQFMKIIKVPNELIVIDISMRIGTL